MESTVNEEQQRLRYVYFVHHAVLHAGNRHLHGARAVHIGRGSTCT